MKSWHRVAMGVVILLASTTGASADFCRDYRGPDWKVWEQRCTKAPEGGRVWWAAAWETGLPSGDVPLQLPPLSDVYYPLSMGWGPFATREKCFEGLKAFLAEKKKAGQMHLGRIQVSCKAHDAGGLRFSIPGATIR